MDCIHVLLLDDNKATNFLHERYLDRQDRIGNVIAFQSGEDALKHLNHSSEHPDLMVLDINMPCMDAWEFLEELRAIELAQNPTIILLTTTISPEDQRKMQNYPEVSNILYKPLDPAAIQLILKDHFPAQLGVN